MSTLPRPGHKELHHQLIEREHRPCARCGAKRGLEVHRLVPRLGYEADNVMVLCYRCHREHHPQSKFQVGDKVFLNGRTPEYVPLSRHRPYTIEAVFYKPELEANVYQVGSKGHEGSVYRFRSYMLHPWAVRGQNGRPREKRPYHHKANLAKTGAMIAPVGVILTGGPRGGRGGLKNGGD